MALPCFCCRAEIRVADPYPDFLCADCLNAGATWDENRQWYTLGIRCPLHEVERELTMEQIAQGDY